MAALPTAVTYPDVFSGQSQTIPNTKQDTWLLHFGPQTTTVTFTYSANAFRDLLKTWCAAMLRAGIEPTSAANDIATLQTVSEHRISDVLRTGPRELKTIWRLLLLEYPSSEVMKSLKGLLRFICSTSSGGDWNPDHLAAVDAMPVSLMDEANADFDHNPGPPPARFWSSFKIWCEAMLRDDLEPSALGATVTSLLVISEGRRSDVLRTPLNELNAIWRLLLPEYPSAKVMKSLQSFLRAIYSHGIGDTEKPEHLTIIDELPLPQAGTVNPDFDSHFDRHPAAREAFFKRL